MGFYVSAAPGTGTGVLVGQTTPTLVTPVLGVAAATSLTTGNGASGASKALIIGIGGGAYVAGSGAVNFQNDSTHDVLQLSAGALTMPSNAVLGWANTVNAVGYGAANDIALYRAGAGQLNVQAGASGQRTGIFSLTELLTIAAAATSTTAIQKPANSIVVGVSVRVTTALPITSTFTVGDAGSATRFNTTTVSKALNSTDPGTKAGAYYNATAEGIIITPDTTPSDATGRVRVTIHYINITPPTA